MRYARALPVLLFATAVVTPAFGADLGRANGTVTIDGKPIVLQYAYAIDHQKNQLNNKSNETKVILTDKPLPDGTKIATLDETSFPDGVNGVVVSVDPKDNVTHVYVQHPAGSYDGGYFEGVQDYHFKRVRGDRGTIGGTISSKKITTNTMAFFFDAEFLSQVQ